MQRNAPPTVTRTCRSQAGFLLEVPLGLMILGCVLAFVLPKLPPLWAAVLLGFAAAAVCGGLWYMIVTPGWRPGEPRPLRRRLTVFALSVATVILIATVSILMILEG